MQVSQREDHITHAVIGGQESISMGMSSDAALMHIFSSTLYTYPDLAAIREPICNGWDAHINAGKTDIPMEISITSDRISIRDFGKGIPHDNIGSIYGVYGNSTKRDDSTVTGGFGLGSKAPFAYTDNFEVISNCEGVKTVYRVSKSWMELGGKPSINKIVSVPTEETGITVSFTLKPGDSGKIRRIVEEVLILGEIKAKINGGEQVATLPLEESPTGYIISSFVGTIHSVINLRYGNVVYPIPVHETYAEQWNTVKRAIGNLWSGANITFLANPDTVSIAPNREALILTDSTLKTVVEMLAKFDPREISRSQDTAKQMLLAAVNVSVEKEPCKVALQRIYEGAGIEYTKLTEGNAHQTGEYAYTVRRAGLINRIKGHGGSVNNNVLTYKRINKMIREKFIPKKMMAAALKIEKEGSKRDNGRTRMLGGSYTQEALTALVHKFITYPLYEKIDAQPKMNRARLFFIRARYYRHADLFSFRGMRIETLREVMGFARKRVLLCRSKTSAAEWVSRLDGQAERSGFLFYQVTSSLESQVKAVEVFESLGYEIFEHLPEKVKETTTVVAADGTTEVVEVKKPAVKRKGLMTLAQSYTSRHRMFLLTTARENWKPETGVEKPIAYVVLNNKSGRPTVFSRFNDKECAVVLKLWGDKVAVVTESQGKTLKKKGVPEVADFVLDYVDKTLRAAKDFPRYLAFSSHAVEDSSRHASMENIVVHMVKHEELMKQLGLRFHISAETAMLLTFYEARKNYWRDETKYLPLCQELKAKVKCSPLYNKTLGTMKNSEWKEFINLDHLGEILQKNPAEVTKVAISHEIVKNLLK